MRDRALEDDLRRAVRRAGVEARAAGNVASRLGSAPDGKAERRWQQLGLLHAGLPEHVGGAGGDLTLPFVVAEECSRDLLTPPALLDGLLAVRSLAAVVEASDAARVALARTLEGDVPAVCWPGVVGRGAGLCWESGSVSGRFSALLHGTGARRLLLVAPLVDGAVRIGTVELDGAEHVELTSVDPTRPAAVLDLAGLPVRELGTLTREGARRLRAFWMLVAAADSLGAMATNLELAMGYVRERTAFGRPIGSFQAVRHRCVEGYVDVETTSAAVIGAGDAWARDDDGALVDVLVAASHAIDAQVRVAESTVLLHGASGFTYEADAQFYLRRAYGVRASVASLRELRIELATA